MSMTSIFKMFWGVVCFLPILLVILMEFFSKEVLTIANAINKDIELYNLIHLEGYVLALLIIVGIIGNVAIVFFSSLVPREKKWLWFFVLILGNIVATPLFWIFYVSKRRLGKRSASRC